MHDWTAPAAGPDGADVPFLDAFNHSFLIRDPAKTLTSMYGQWTDFTLDETGFAEQRAPVRPADREHRRPRLR